MSERDRLTLQMGVAGRTDSEEVDELTRLLRRRLLDLDVGAVEAAPGGEPPAGAKVGDLVEVGTLILTITQSVGAVSAVVTTVRSWLDGHPERTVEVEVGGDKIRITGASSEEQDRIVGAWLERRAEDVTAP
jgi:Effector Associated Constant Component 1